MELKENKREQRNRHKKGQLLRYESHKISRNCSPASKIPRCLREGDIAFRAPKLIVFTVTACMPLQYNTTQYFIQYNTPLHLPMLHLGVIKNSLTHVRATKTVNKKRNNLKFKITILKSI